MFEKIVELGILFDFYGKLLSENQYTVVELYYIHDLSLSEIGEELGITRQGVYDSLKRAENNLYDFENNLGLVEKFKNVSNEVNNILKYVKVIVKDAEDLNNQEIVNNAKAIKTLAEKIIEDNQEVT
ncbi:MAG TPA: sigma factor-like helix-turn-helix DNA-binding protein [Tissierellales bacterium]|nr:sigma factor-like helix-turn-helix DNA-binding protein [Tissierellales bacterium]